MVSGELTAGIASGRVTPPSQKTTEPIAVPHADDAAYDGRNFSPEFTAFFLQEGVATVTLLRPNRGKRDNPHLDGSAAKTTQMGSMNDWERP